MVTTDKKMAGFGRLSRPRRPATAARICTADVEHE